MVFLFRDKSVSGIVLLLLLLLAVHFHFIIEPPKLIINSEDGIIGILLKKIAHNSNTAVFFILYLVCVFAQAIRLNFALNHFKMFQHQHQTVAMSYILLSGFFVQWCYFSSALITNFLIIWIFIKLAQLSTSSNAKALLFNIGIITSCSILAYHPTYIIILVLFFALAVTRSFKIVEWVILIMGVILPFYFLASWLYLTNQLSNMVHYLPDIHLHMPLKISSIWIWISLGVLLLATLAGIYFNSINSSRMIIQIRKNWNILFIMLILLLPTSFLFGNTTLEASMLGLVPLAAIISNAYSYPKRLLLPNLLFWLSIAVILFNNRLIIKY
jgi:hypothetical protein